MKSKFILFFLVVFAISISNAQKVNIADFEQAFQQDWVGSLTYKNYSDGKMVSIPCNLSVNQLDDKSFAVNYSYPDEPKANSKGKIVIKKKGGALGKGKIIQNELKDDGTRIIKTKSKGKDNNKKANIIRTYSLSPRVLTIKKEVNYIGETEKNLVRNIYEFKR